MPTITTPHILPKKLLAFFSFLSQIRFAKPVHNRQQAPCRRETKRAFRRSETFAANFFAEIDLRITQMKSKDTKAKMAFPALC
jgi:hypothetical protein